MRQVLRVTLLGVFVVLLFGAINARHVHPPSPPADMPGHHTAGHHAMMLAALTGHTPEPESTAVQAQPGHDDDTHMLLRLCLAALLGAFGFVAWLFARATRRPRSAQLPVFSRPPPRPAARSRPPTGRVLAQLCVLRT